jgi:hypothetical protein
MGMVIDYVDAQFDLQCDASNEKENQPQNFSHERPPVYGGGAGTVHTLYSLYSLYSLYTQLRFHCCWA